MALRTYGPGLVLDQTSMKGVPNTAGVVRDPITNAVLTTYDLDGVTPKPVVTNRFGYFEQFQADSSDNYVSMDFAGIPLDMEPTGGVAVVATDPTKVAKTGDTMTGTLTMQGSKVVAGSATDVLGSALEVVRNGVTTGRVDNNASGMRVQAQAGTLQLRGTGNTGMSVDSTGKVSFDAGIVLKTYTTAGRPSAATVGEGGMIYDSDLDIVLKSDGAAWTQVGSGSAPPGEFPPFPIGKQTGITRANNSAGLVGATLGTEYAIAIQLPAGSYDRIQIEVGVAGTAGSTMRFGLRPIAADGTIGSPVVDAAASIAATGTQFATFTALVVANPTWYALSYTRVGDTGGTSQLQRGPADIQNGNVKSLARNTTAPALGHAPFQQPINTGVTTSLPSSVTIADQGTNIDSGYLPVLSIRRSA